MLASQRRSHIVGLVQRCSAARVADLVAELGVSDMTVRRDIDLLAAQGLVERVHGGVVAVGGHSTEEPGFGAKSGLMRPQKQAIAVAAARLVQPGAAIGISAGTTAFELARAVRQVPDLTVVTNSVPVAQLLHESHPPGLTVVLTGGERTPSEALVGPVAVSALRLLHVDQLFLGVHGLDAQAGLTTPSLVEAETNRAFIGAARRVCVVADHTKWGTVGLGTIVDLPRVDLLITDDGLPVHARRAVTTAGVELLLADSAHPAAAAKEPETP